MKQPACRANDKKERKKKKEKEKENEKKKRKIINVIVKNKHGFPRRDETFETQWDSNLSTRE